MLIAFISTSRSTSVNIVIELESQLNVRPPQRRVLLLKPVLLAAHLSSPLPPSSLKALSLLAFSCQVRLSPTLPL